MRFPVNLLTRGFQHEEAIFRRANIGAIKQHDAGTKVDDICRDMSVSVGTFYNWRSKYAGLEVNEAKRLKVLESENNKLKKLPADKLLENEAMNDVLSIKWRSLSTENVSLTTWYPSTVSAFVKPAGWQVLVEQALPINLNLSKTGNYVVA